MKRKYVFVILIIAVSLVFISRLFYLQIIDDSYKFMADANSRREVVKYPARGYIYDRNDSLMVANQAAYNLMVVYKEMQEPFDTLELAGLLKIGKNEFKQSIDRFRMLVRSRMYSLYQPYPLVMQISKEDYPSLQEKLFKYPGFSIEKTVMRDYVIKAASNVLGYLSEISDRKQIDENRHYRLGDIMGATGVEKMYENELRGIPGIHYEQINVSGKASGSYMDGKYDTEPVAGKDIVLSLDAELQKYGEMLMQGKRGSIVAIEPSTGEILALVTAPSYDPSLLSGRQRSANYNRLVSDPAIPMFDRGLIAEYSPGSTWKIVTGLAALQTGATNPSFTTVCHGGYRVGSHLMGCLSRASYPLNLELAYQHSCNTHFATIYRKTIEKGANAEEGFNDWYDVVLSLGFGKYLDTDLSTGRKGNIPTAEYYNRIYGKGGWSGQTIISNAIGQGEVSVTPIQLANLAAAVANGGFYYRPHVIKEIKGGEIPEEFKEKQHALVAKEHFAVVKQGMANVFRAGTARWVGIPEFEMCGKTGSVQNYKRIGGKRVELPSHSTFVAFGPKDDSKIAVSVVVENGEFGARWAAPIASLMIEKYVLGKSGRKYLEDAMVNGSLEAVYAMYEDKKQEK